MGAVETELQYQLTPEHGGSDEIWPGLVKALRVPRVMVKMKITDVRGSESDYTIDKQGFAWVNAPTAQKTWEDDEEIERVYYPECEELLKKVTGASHAFAFNHVQRGEDWSKVMKDIESYKDDDIEFRSANNCYIHCDYSYRGAEQFYERFVVNGPREDLKPLAANPRRRWALINLWRPRKTVNRDALCVADAHSIKDDELAEQTIRWLKPEELTEAQKNHPQFKKYQAGAPDTFLWAVKPPATPESHKWYYASGMTPDEVLLFKMYDSRADEGIPRRVPHTSFRSEFDNGPPRESVELRAFVIWDDQDGDL
ncbi:hypothetical protein CERZMDRAFT_81979 [Cercospora zeae-maydis SCOH1-5]|uniref:GA4 desaturase family protein n=1 Tax=Cercospora zeae-maydis SCOH1-5 TaxID=717836 RepID=A0A6A6FRV7_9PEZI|nr:hypothetical protein CERZMDRAFT_81979 [Cercospora zeae-maydis SCOH1-5]